MFPRLIFIFTLISINSCSSVHYYAQAIGGHTKLLLQREAVEKALADGDIDAETTDKLRLTQSILAFANKSGLTTGDAYKTYVETGEPYVVWNVFAAPEFSLSLKQFCFPIVGCTSYKGFFKKSAAEQAAAQLSSEGLDVFVGGVAAYSTLGWFSDPILDSFLVRSDSQLAALIFHELAHRQLYVKGDSQFNESFATAIERFLLQQWLVKERRLPELAAFEAAIKRQHQMLQLVTEVKKELDVVYSQDVAVETRRQAKQNLFIALREKYQVMQEDWQGNEDYRGWVMSELNNAKLGTLTTYNNWVASFNALLARENGDIRAFIASAKDLVRLDRDQRDQRLAVLAE
jgi:predicted aminopeptidase